MEKVNRTGITVLLYALVFVLLIDPADLIFHMKAPLFISIMIIWLFEKVRCNSVRFKNDSLYFVLAYIAITIYGVTMSLFQGSMDNPIFALGFCKSVSILVLLFVIDDLNIRLDKILIRTSIVLPLLTIFIFAIFIQDPIYFTNVIFPYFDEDTSTAMLAPRNYYGFEVSMFFFKTSPLLVFPLGYYTYRFINKGNKLVSFFLAILFLFTMILSGTRANMLSAFLIFTIVIFIKLVSNKNKLPLIFASILLFTLIVLFLKFASFDEQDLSQQVKSEHFDSYIDLFKANPQYLLWGQGLGSEFYSKGFGEFVPQTELTYLDIIRIFGLPLGLLFILLTLYPIIHLLKNYKIDKEVLYYVLVFSSYLFIAGTNPLLISSTGMLAILSIFSVLNCKSNLAETPVIITNSRTFGF